MDRLASMGVFVRAVEAGSFRAASAGLGMSPQMVAAHVRFLEDRLGVRLLQRTTRAQSLTEAGQAYFERCKLVLAEAEAADAVGADHAAAPRGCLHISAPLTYGSFVLAPVVADFLRAFPEVRVDLDISDRPVSLVEERHEVAFRLGPLADTSLVARRLADYRLVLCASPDYLGRKGAVRAPSDLGHHDCLAYAAYSGATWTDWHCTRNGAVEAVRVVPRLQASDGRTLAEAARAGLGVTMGAEALLQQDLAAGRLVRLLDGWECPRRKVHLLFAPDRHRTRKLRCFLDFVADALPTRLPSLT